MNCPKCGRPVTNPNASFCSGCGYKFLPVQHYCQHENPASGFYKNTQQQNYTYGSNFNYAQNANDINMSSQRNPQQINYGYNYAPEKDSFANVEKNIGAEPAPGKKKKIKPILFGSVAVLLIAAIVIGCIAIGFTNKPAVKLAKLLGDRIFDTEIINISAEMDNQTIDLNVLFGDSISDTKIYANVSNYIEIAFDDNVVYCLSDGEGAAKIELGCEKLDIKAGGNSYPSEDIFKNYNELFDCDLEEIVFTEDVSCINKGIDKKEFLSEIEKNYDTSFEILSNLFDTSILSDNSELTDIIDSVKEKIDTYDKLEKLVKDLFKNFDEDAINIERTDSDGNTKIYSVEIDGKELYSQFCDFADKNDIVLTDDMLDFDCDKDIYFEYATEGGKLSYIEVEDEGLKIEFNDEVDESKLDKKINSVIDDCDDTYVSGECPYINISNAITVLPIMILVPQYVKYYQKSNDSSLASVAEDILACIKTYIADPDMNMTSDNNGCKIYIYVENGGLQVDIDGTLYTTDYDGNINYITSGYQLGELIGFTVGSDMGKTSDRYTISISRDENYGYGAFKATLTKE